MEIKIAEALPTLIYNEQLWLDVDIRYEFSSSVWVLFKVADNARVIKDIKGKIYLSLD